MAKKILVVDDSVTMVMSLKSTLTMNGFQAESAGNGREALDKLTAGLKPDLIVTDINMPVMGGMDLIRHVRAIPGLKFIPILTLTTESEKRRQAGRRDRLAGETRLGQRPCGGHPKGVAGGVAKWGQ